MMNENRIRESKIRERRRHIYRILCELLLLIIKAAVFYCIWMNFYNPNFRNPYVFKGNIFAACVYVVLNLLMDRFYGGLKLGYHKPFNIIFGMSLTSVLTNIAAYFIIIIQAATWFLTPVPAVVYMSLIDIAVVIIWGLVFSRLFRAVFPPNRLILVTQKSAEEIIGKFAERSDRYHIEKTVVLPETYGTVAERDAKTAEGSRAGGCSGGIGNAATVNADMLKALYDSMSDFDGVIIGDMTAELRNDILKNCYANGVRTYTMPKITDVMLKSSETLEAFDSPMFLNRNSGITPEQAAVKRLSDIIMSLMGLIIASPFMLVIAAAIKLEDHGPVFYKQKRCTKDGKVFEILKFRSMIVNAEQSGISVPATERDPRITKVGRVIRATRFDELPQIINILKGEMSVVGPRPERIEHVREYSAEIPEFKYRMAVKGGLTGYAQVYGKYNTTPYDKLKLDLLYIQNYSIFLDLEIILKTVQVMFTKESTEGFDKQRSEEMTKLSRENVRDAEPKDTESGTGNGARPAVVTADEDKSPIAENVSDRISTDSKEG